MARAGRRPVAQSLLLLILGVSGVAEATTPPVFTGFANDVSRFPIAAGEEVRVSVTAVYNGSTTDVNITDIGEFNISVFRVDASAAGDCGVYNVSGTILHTALLSGADIILTDPVADTFGASAYTTFVAPNEAFHVCYLHTLNDTFSRSSSLDGFQSFTYNDGTTSHTDMTPTAGTHWYYLEASTRSQYAIVQILTNATNDFTYPASACGNTSDASASLSDLLTPCAEGDNVKIVPAGMPCTYEPRLDTVAATLLPYYGSEHVNADGSWKTAALNGLLEGATVGGVGRMGTQYANPIVDRWGTAGAYASAGGHSTAYSAQPQRHAYAYVKIPDTVGGNYDVCFSSLNDRKDSATATAAKNASLYELPSLPVWRKLLRCDTAACASNEPRTETSFVVVNETIAWTAFDYTPMTWGYVSFRDTAAAGTLSTKPASNPIRAGRTFTAGDGTVTTFDDGCVGCTDPTPPLVSVNYWLADGDGAGAGGDFFRIVPESAFGEAAATATGHGAAYSTPALGSFANTGCWDRSFDVPNATTMHGGFTEDIAAMAIGSSDLTADPYLDADAAANSTDAAGQNHTFGRVFMPANGTVWYVCYRAAGSPRAGMRVLRWEEQQNSNWARPTAYTPGTAYAGAQPLVPDVYNVTGGGFDVHPDAAWAMADTRAGTYGELNVAITQRDAHDFVHRIGFNGSIPLDEELGSALRVVPSDAPCDAATHASLASGVDTVYIEDGGAFECRTKLATNDTIACMGRHDNATNRTSVVYTFTVPPVRAGGYRVCFRVGALNWRALENALTPSADPVASAAIALTSQEMRSGMEALFVVTSTAADVVVDAFAGTSSGAVLRMVRHGETCDIVPTTWAQQSAVADTHLSVYCPKAGAGTAATSGLTEEAPCWFTPVATTTFCAGRPCNTNPQFPFLDSLAAMAQATPDIYDDIVPYDHSSISTQGAVAGHTSAAAVIRMPPHDTFTPDMNRYRVCLRQSQTRNWVMFPGEYVVQPAQNMIVETPAAGATLMSGELQRFSLRYLDPVATSLVKSVLPDNLDSFSAKLVKVVEGGANDNCLNPAAGTETDSRASATRKYRVGVSEYYVDFRLPIPHSLGKHWLCVQAPQSANETMSWYRSPRPYEVVDNGVRWYVASDNTPAAQTVGMVHFIKCKASANGEECSTTGVTDVFSTSPGQDSVKIIARDHSCHAGTHRYEESEDHGSSYPVSMEAILNGWAESGDPDIGPFDGPSVAARARITPPYSTSDLEQRYKVCVKTAYDAVGLRPAVWAEVRQARNQPGQNFLTQPDLGLSMFVMSSARFSHWSLYSGLRPGSVLIPDDVLRSSTYGPSVGLAGAGTQYVTAHQTNAPGTGSGLTIHMFANADITGVSSDHEFKLVLVRYALTQLPPGPSGAGWIWEGIGQANCDESPPVDSATNLNSNCTANPVGGCPGLAFTAASKTLDIHMHLPLQVGAYMVCFRVNNQSQWLWLKDGESSSPLLHTHPSYFEFDASQEENVTVNDLRVVETDTGDVASLASWCSVNQISGKGVPCAAQNSAIELDGQASGYFTDLIKAIPAHLTCIPPTVSGRRAFLIPPDGWFNLIRVNNASARVWDTWSSNTGLTWQLPPSYKTNTGRYKICVYKAGDLRSRYGGDVVAHGGVVYQVPERGTELGYWIDEVSVNNLDVATLDDYDMTHRFMFYDANTTAAYSDVPSSLITQQPEGFISHTHVHRSGTAVSFLVTAMADTDPVPYGSAKVWVERCKPPTTWDDIACENVLEDVDPEVYELQNIGGECTEGAKYGWSKDGLEQFLVSGQSLFRLQYKSSCAVDATNNKFGCGLRFAMVPSGQNAVVYSKPVWVNIAAHYPDAVQVDDVDVLSNVKPVQPEKPYDCTATSKDCYFKECVTGRPCEIIIRARYQGPLEYAAAGKLSVGFGSLDYGTYHGLPTSVARAFEPDSWPEVNGVLWRKGGSYTYTTVPRLRATESSGFVYLNISYGLDKFLKPQYPASWVRVVVSVRRDDPVALRLLDLVPLDMHGLTGPGTPRTPVDVWFTENPDRAFSKPTTRLVAQEGAYIQSLMPYELSFRVCTDLQEECAETFAVGTTPLGTWTLSAEVLNQPDNDVLLTYWAEKSGSVVFSEDNLKTSPAYTANRLDSVIPGNMRGNGTTFRQWFRVLNNIGCSRFNVPTGCAIQFTLNRGTERLSAIVQTPVRVVAQTIKVVSDVPLSSVTSITDGIPVTVMPGTVMRDTWLPDEHHYGSLFVLISTPEPSDGVSNRDGVSLIVDADVPVDECIYRAGPNDPTCLVGGYHPQALGGVWGRRWTLRTTKPCYNCEFTFHSTWGAGPESFTPDGYGSVSLSLGDDTDFIQCWLDDASQDGVGMLNNETESERFTVYVQPKNAKGFNTRWPSWWVYLEPNDVMAGDQPLTDVAVVAADGGAVKAFFKRDAAGMAVAELKDLRFSGQPLAAAVTVVTMTFRTVGVTYDPTYTGTAGDGNIALSCDTTLQLRNTPVAQPQNYMQVLDVQGATAMCADAVGCTKWHTTTSELTLTVSVQLWKVPGQGIAPEIDKSARNLTAAVPHGRLAQWECASLSAPCVTEPIKMVSPYTDNTRWSGKGDSTVPLVYSFGAPSVTLRGSIGSKGISSDEGVAVVYINQNIDNDQREPVREANFSVCATAAGSATQLDSPGNWVNEENCLIIHLWILADSSASVGTKLFSVAPGQTTTEYNAGTDVCGVGGTAFNGRLIATHFMANQYFLIYYKRIAFSVQTAAQGDQEGNLFSEASDPLTTQQLITKTNSVLLTKKLEERLQAVDDFWVDISVYGLQARSVPAPFIFGASDIDSPNLVIATEQSTQSYTWVRPSMKPYTQWEVLDEVMYDDECPNKRLFTTSTSHYRTHKTIPGQGWRYMDGVSVGVPFPIQTVVKTATVDGQPVASQRAWDFTPSLVFAKKKQWGGCNDGGELVVQQLTPSTESITKLFLPSVLQPAFIETSTPDAVLTNSGVSTSWLTLSMPCERCTLELSLCYTSAVSAATCFDDPDGDLNGTPLLASRTKVTKPFTVRKAEADDINVVASTPQALTESERIAVGEPFQTTFQTVSTYSSWAMPASALAVRVWVTSKWSHPQQADYMNAGLMRYGSGGFLSSGAALTATQCDVQPEQFIEATRMGVYLGPNSNLLRYFFNRPCSSCELWYSYEISRTDGGVVSGYFPHRRMVGGSDTVGNVVRYTVYTCGSQWITTGLPPATVRRRVPFSLTAWLVDSNRLPAWSGSALLALNLFQPVKPGNGDGGELRITSPVNSDDEILAVNGTATVRFHLTRSCYACTVFLGSQSHDFTVITNPERIIAIPDYTTPYMQYTSPDRMSVTWEFQLYAADDLGDRAFPPGGPTYLGWLPVYNDRRILPQRLDATPQYAEDPDAVAAAITTIIVGGKRRSFSVSANKPNVRVTSGTLVHDGVPFDYDSAKSVVRVEVSGSPGPAFDLQFKLDSKDIPSMTMTGEPLPLMRWTVPPSLMALDQPSSVTLRQGDPLVVKAYLLGQKAGEVSFDGEYFLSTADVDGHVQVVVNCSVGCPACRFGPNSVVPGIPGDINVLKGNTHFNAGVAQFEVSFRQVGDRVEETCDVIVAVKDAEDLAGAEPQTFTISAKPVALRKWTFTSSNVTDIAEDFTSPSASTHVTPGNPVWISLQAYDETFDPDSIVAGIDRADKVRLIMEPSGCFVCDTSQCPTCAPNDCTPTFLGNATTAPYGSRMIFAGEFRTVEERETCVVKDIQNLPSRTELSQSLTAVITKPRSISIAGPFGIVTDTTPPEEKYWNMRGRTSQNKMAMVAGHPALLRVQINGADGNMVRGDSSTKVTLTGTRVHPSYTEYMTIEGVARGGIAEFALNLQPTRSGCTNSVPPEDVNGTAVLVCNHHPWDISVSAFGQMLRVGPLSVVSQADRLRVQIRSRSSDGDWVDLRAPGQQEQQQRQQYTHWVWGYPFSMKVTAIDDSPPRACNSVAGEAQCKDNEPSGCVWFNNSCTGTAVKPAGLHPEDVSSTAVLTLRPVGTPCEGFDKSVELRSNMCAFRRPVHFGSCETVALPRCGLNGFLVNSADELQRDQLTLKGGSIVIDAVEFAGDVMMSRVPGLQTFFLSSSSLYPRLEAKLDTPSILYPTLEEFPVAIVFQKLHRILSNEGDSVCRGAGNAADPAVCTLPRAVFPLVTRKDAFTDKEFAFPRIATGTAFNVVVRMTDKDNQTVAGDVDSTLELAVTCHVPEDIMRVGLLAGIRGTTVKQEPGWNISKAVGGVVRFDNLGFEGTCGNVSIRVVCRTGLNIDRHDTCKGLTMRTEFFEVGGAAGSTPIPPTTPAPVFVSDFPRMQFSIGDIDLRGFGNADKAALEAKYKDDLTVLSGRHVETYMRYACSITRADLPAGLTMEDKLDPNVCKAWERTAGRAALALQQGCASDCVSVVEFEVEVLSAVDENDNMKAEWQDALLRYTNRILSDVSSRVRTAYPEASTEGVSIVRVGNLTAVPTTPVPLTSPPPTAVPTAAPATDAPPDNNTDVITRVPISPIAAAGAPQPQGVLLVLAALLSVLWGLP